MGQKTQTSGRRTSGERGWRRLWAGLRCRRGVAAIEFALISPILFILIMGVIETGLVYYAQFVLKHAVSNTARILRTNQDSSLNSVAALQSYICETEGADSILGSCTSKIHIIGAAFDSVLTSYAADEFSNVVAASSLKDGELYSNLTSYADDGSIATACNVVYLRVFYPWKVITPGLSWFLVNYGDDKRVLSVTEVFRNEPTGTDECSNSD